MNQLIDRRLNGRNKSVVNRERFLRRYKEQIGRSAKTLMEKRSIKDMDRGGEVHVPARDIAEPTFRHGAGGDRELVLPGNRHFSRGDLLPRPKGGDGSGGSEAGEGDAMDEFTFSLSRAEFLSIFFDDLELPRMERTMLGRIERQKPVRAGYSISGAPCNLSVTRTLKMAYGRRIALQSSIDAQIEEARKRLTMSAYPELNTAQVRELEEETAALEARRAQLPFLEDVDLRYRNRTSVPDPATRAVMFCLMDVSGSMDERKKDLAKRFFTLLYLFLSSKYENVEVVFIRHTEHAEEVDEPTFFSDPRSGGTVVLSALELMREVVLERYGGDWNVYAAQASDGDAFGADPARSARFVAEQLLPLTRHFAYVETPDGDDAGASPLWAEYAVLSQNEKSFATRRVLRAADIYPVFRELFARTPA